MEAPPRAGAFFMVQKAFLLYKKRILYKILQLFKNKYRPLCEDDQSLKEEKI